jgi:hypothetical protein
MRTWLYHPNRPEGQLYENLDGPLSARLAEEGWVASPADLPAKALTPSLQGEVLAVIKAPSSVPVSSSGRVMTAATAPVSDLADRPFAPLVAAALARYARLFDADGDAQHASLSDEDVLTILTDMAREELLNLTGMLDLGPATEADSDQLRLKALSLLRPSMTLGLVPDPAASDLMTKAAADGVSPEIVETQKPDASSSDGNWTDWAAQSAASLRAELDARGIVYKARDGKEKLVEMILANPRKE